MAAENAHSVKLNSPYQKEFVIHPRLPYVNGIFDLGPNTLIASHPPHGRITEHLHDHLHHMHIRYGFEIPRQPLTGFDASALEVAMLVKTAHRVDCNPIFVDRGPGSEGICLKIAGQDVHWVHNEEVGKKATKLYESTGRRLPKGYYFSGFRTSDVDEREVWYYSREELLRAIGHGLRADQHFQATWREPRDEPIEPYAVTICLSDSETYFHTFFQLQPTITLGAF
ncbi:MAG: hypothetical protein AAGD01_16290 [Acidobacteriota bacterium]